MAGIELERQVVQQRNQIDLLQQENQELKVDLENRSEFNKLILQDRNRISNDVAQLETRLDSLEARVKVLENKPEKLNVIKFLK